MSKKATLRFTHSTFSAQIAKKLGVDNMVSKVREGTHEMQVDSIQEFEGIADKISRATGERPLWAALYDNDTSRQELKAAGGARMRVLAFA